MCGGVTEIYWSTCGGLLAEYGGWECSRGEEYDQSTLAYMYESIILYVLYAK